MTERLSNAALAIACGIVLFLHACSPDFAPWMDEVHIVEMGRIVFGSTSESILTNPDGSFSAPVYYLGPLCHEFAFRLGGPTAVRLLPLLALFAATFFFRLWIRRNKNISPGLALLLSLAVLTLPLFVQSVRMVRVDMAVITISFAILALIDRPWDATGRFRLAMATVLSGLSPFLWPSAIMLFPLTAVFWLKHSREAHRTLGAYATDTFLVLTLTAFTMMLVLFPVRHQIPQLIGTFVSYFSGAGANTAVGSGDGFNLLDTLRGLAVLLVKESLRAPFFYLLLPLGFFLTCRRTPLVVAAFGVAFLLGVLTGLHTFRNIFLFPYLILFFVSATDFLQRRIPQFARTILIAAVGYGFITGPFAFALVRTGTTGRITPGINGVAAVRPDAKVFNLDYSAYYNGRQLGWRQSAYPLPAQAVDDKAKLVDTCDAVLLPVHNRYRPIEESYTLYGLLRGICLSKARGEQKNPSPSLLGRIGEAFAYDDFPLVERQQFLKRLLDSGFKPMTKATSPSDAILLVRSQKRK